MTNLFLKGLFQLLNWTYKSGVHPEPSFMSFLDSLRKLLIYPSKTESSHSLKPRIKTLYHLLSHNTQNQKQNKTHATSLANSTEASYPSHRAYALQPFFVLLLLLHTQRELKVFSCVCPPLFFCCQRFKSFHYHTVNNIEGFIFIIKNETFITMGGYNPWYFGRYNYLEGGFRSSFGQGGFTHSP